jgi:hypothetical protein
MEAIARVATNLDLTLITELPSLKIHEMADKLRRRGETCNAGCDCDDPPFLGVS